MVEADLLQRQLIQEQNADGGWGYANRTSWIEPTALAILALEAHRNKGNQYERACTRLARLQSSDGGWAPQPAVLTSTWVTSLAALALSDNDRYSENFQRGNEWLIRQVKPESSPLERLVLRLRQGTSDVPLSGGSPWFPGTAAWVIPTAMSIFAFSRARSIDPKFKTLIQAAQRYLLSRRCLDGGWNHGGSRYRSENATSYPETTGLALLAISGAPSSELEVSLKCAETFLQVPGSVEGSTWLRLALSKHGRNIPTTTPEPRCRTTRDVCLRLLALAPASTNKLMLL